jgi:hypothetical protein
VAAPSGEVTDDSQVHPELSEPSEPPAAAEPIEPTEPTSPSQQ